MGFRKIIKVRFSDSDPAGVLYFPRFLDHFHGVFEDWFDEDLKMPYRWVLEDTHVGFPTVHVDCDYNGPFRFGERMDVELVVSRVGDRSFTCTYRARAEGEAEVRVEARVVTAVVDLKNFVAIDIPPALRRALTERLESAPRGMRLIAGGVAARS